MQWRKNAKKKIDAELEKNNDWAAYKSRILSTIRTRSTIELESQTLPVWEHSIRVWSPFWVGSISRIAIRFPSINWNLSRRRGKFHKCKEFSEFFFPVSEVGWNRHVDERNNAAMCTITLATNEKYASLVDLKKNIQKK